MSSAPVPIPHSSGELWLQIVRPHVEDELRRISANFPETVLPPDFQNSFLLIAEKNYREEVGKKKNFGKWADEIEDWKEWAHSLIPYREINPTYLAALWGELCKREASEHGFIFIGRVPQAVKKVAGRLKPKDMDYENFFDTVLNEMCVNFMRRYFSSFQEPVDAWLYELAKTSAQDFVKTWVPGMRLSKEEDRPSIFESIDVPQKGPRGEPLEPLKETLPGSQPSAVDKAIDLVESISKIHEKEGRWGKLSNTVIKLRSQWGYTQREIAREVNRPIKEVEQTLNDDLKRWYIIGTEELGIRPRGPKS